LDAQFSMDGSMNLEQRRPENWLLACIRIEYPVIVGPNILIALSSPLPDSDFGKRFDPRRMIVFIVVPFERLGHHERPPKTLPFMGDPCSFLSRSLSVQSNELRVCRRTALLQKKRR
jgi:hypothetical protein